MSLHILRYSVSSYFALQCLFSESMGTGCCKGQEEAVAKDQRQEDTKAELSASGLRARRKPKIIEAQRAQLEALGSSAEDAEVWTNSMTDNSRDMRPPLQQSRLWKIPPIRALLLGTTSQGSVLCQLPKSDGVLNIILGFVVLHYEHEVPCV